VNEHKSSAANGDRPLDCSLDVPLLPDDRVSAHPHLVNTPIEPLEALEPSAHTQVPGQLYRDYDSSIGDRDETAARVKSLGIDAPLYKSFRCIIPGHNHQARVHPTTAGFWEYRCEGITGGAGLGEVRAFVAYGCKRHLSSLEAARWRERLDYEAHLRSPVPLNVEFPEPCPESARIVVGRMRLFVGLRDARFPFNEPFVFAHDFAQAYCGLTADRVRDGKNWLERASVIYRAGKHGRSILWKLTAQDACAAGNESRGRS
jgi:hypothetical protein